MSDNPAVTLDNLHVTASEHCGWAACIILDHARAILPPGGDLAPTYALIHRLSVEAADCILFPAVLDEERCMALAEVIAQGAVEEARQRAAKVHGA